jgi:hypothetical protein
VKEKDVYCHFLQETLPLVLLNVKNNIHDGEIIYLSLKILWRVVRWEMEEGMMKFVEDWMELIHLTIAAYNEEMQIKLDEIQVKSTP